MPMDQIGLPLPCHAHKTQSVAGDATQSNKGLFQGLRISLNRMMRRVRAQSFFASRVNNGPAQNQGRRHELRLSRSDAVAVEAANTLQFTSSTRTSLTAPASTIYPVQDAPQNQGSESQLHASAAPAANTPQRRLSTPSTSFKAPAPTSFEVEYEQDKKDRRALIIDLFTKRLAIAIQEAEKQCEQAISKLGLSFPELKEVPPLEGKVPFLNVPMPKDDRPQMIKNAQKIFNDFQNRFPKHGTPCKEAADTAQMLWTALHSMHFQNESDTTHAPQFGKIMQDARNNISELLLLNIAGKKIGAQSGEVSREEINHQYRACFQAARNDALLTLIAQYPPLLRRLKEDQLNTLIANYDKDFSEAFKTHSPQAYDFLPAVLAQVHENVKTRVEPCNEETLERIKKLVAESITPTMLLAKMSSAVATALTLPIASTDTAPALPKRRNILFNMLSRKK